MGFPCRRGRGKGAPGGAGNQSGAEGVSDFAQQREEGSLGQRTRRAALGRVCSQCQGLSRPSPGDGSAGYTVSRADRLYMAKMCLLRL